MRVKVPEGQVTECGIGAAILTYGGGAVIEIDDAEGKEKIEKKIFLPASDDDPLSEPIKIEHKVKW